MVGCITSTRGHWEEFLSLIQNNSCNVSNILLLSQVFIVWKSLTQPSTSDFIWEIEENHGLYSTSTFLPILKRDKFRLKNKIGKDVTFQGRKLSPAMWFLNVSAHDNPWWGCWTCFMSGAHPQRILSQSVSHKLWMVLIQVLSWGLLKMPPEIVASQCT